MDDHIVADRNVGNIRKADVKMVPSNSTFPISRSVFTVERSITFPGTGETHVTNSPRRIMRVGDRDLPKREAAIVGWHLVMRQHGELLFAPGGHRFSQTGILF